MPEPADIETAAETIDAVPVADRELLEELMRQGGVLTETSRPKLSEYVADVLSGTLRRLVEWLFGGRSIDETAIEVVQWMIVALVAVLVVMLAWQWIRWWRRRLPPEQRQLAAVEVLEAPPEQVDWRRELERRLEEGDAPGALEALWWWLATRLGQAHADASWTTRELARRAGRRDLMPLVRLWDRLVYGGGEVDVDGVRHLWLRLREALA